MSKTGALGIQMTKAILCTKRVLFLNSGYGFMSTLLELEKSSIYRAVMYKQKGVGCPRVLMIRFFWGTCKETMWDIRPFARGVILTIQTLIFGWLQWKNRSIPQSCWIHGQLGSREPHDSIMLVGNYRKSITLNMCKCSFWL